MSPLGDPLRQPCRQRLGLSLGARPENASEQLLARRVAVGCGSEPLVRLGTRGRGTSGDRCVRADLPLVSLRPGRNLVVGLITHVGLLLFADSTTIDDPAYARQRGPSRSST